METKDRHREGYYKDYAERTGKKDRHSEDYYKKYRERKKFEKEASSASVFIIHFQYGNQKESKGEEERQTCLL